MGQNARMSLKASRGNGGADSLHGGSPGIRLQPRLKLTWG